jgi:hypothetical protein
VTEVENSQKFISDDFEKQKGELNKMSDRERIVREDNVQLKKQIRKLHVDLNEESSKRNEASQYIRSSFMVELSGLPPSQGKNENTLELVKKVAELGKYEDFDVNQVDVTHRLSTHVNSPVIIMFSKKQYRQNFYHQKAKLKFIHKKQLTD